MLFSIVMVENDTVSVTRAGWFFFFFFIYWIAVNEFGVSSKNLDRWFCRKAAVHNSRFRSNPTEHIDFYLFDVSSSFITDYGRFFPYACYCRIRSVFHRSWSTATIQIALLCGVSVALFFVPIRIAPKRGAFLSWAKLFYGECWVP